MRFFSLEHMKIDHLMDGAVSYFWLQALSFVDKLTHFIYKLYIFV